MLQVIKLLKILFLERRLPTKGYSFFKKIGIPIKTRKICTKNGLVLKGLYSYFFVLRQIEQYEIPGFRIKTGMHIIDIGANQGFFTVVSANKGAEIYAFEPDRRNFEILQWNVRRNKLTNFVKSFNVACSDKDGFIKLFIPIREKEKDFRSSLISTSKNFIKDQWKFDNCKIESVRAINFNSFLDDEKNDKWDLLKIDCEGAEYDILACISKDNFNKIERIVMETHKGGNDIELVQLLNNANFKIINFKKQENKNTGFIVAIK